MTKRNHAHSPIRITRFVACALAVAIIPLSSCGDPESGDLDVVAILAATQTEDEFLETVASLSSEHGISVESMLNYDWDFGDMGRPRWSSPDGKYAILARTDDDEEGSLVRVFSKSKIGSLHVAPARSAASGIVGLSDDEKYLAHVLSTELHVYNIPRRRDKEVLKSTSGSLTYGRMSAVWIDATRLLAVYRTGEIYTSEVTWSCPQSNPGCEVPDSVRLEPPDTYAIVDVDGHVAGTALIPNDGTCPTRDVSGVDGSTVLLGLSAAYPVCTFELDQVTTGGVHPVPAG